MKLWAGRFQKETNDVVNDFNSSIQFDGRLYREDITGSIAHATMLGKQGIIEEHESEKIVAGLKEILKEVDAGELDVFNPEYEDIHMNVEVALTKRIGDTGKRLHTARSRNDQVALDMRMYVKKEICEIMDLAIAFEKELVAKAKDNLDTVMPGYTHLQRAQPTTFGHYMMAYAQMLRRDISRLEDCYERMDELPLGSGALASTTYPIDRQFVCDKLGFARVTENSLDGVSDRDYCIELMSCLSLMMMHLSRLSEEVISWCSWEWRFAELDDAYSTGSSIMPQKKNPDVCELIRGKTGRVYGDLMTLLTTMKALPLAYNKDMQEDKESVFDACDTVKACLGVFNGMIASMRAIPENMLNAAKKGFINATDVADYLTKKGEPFRSAYKISGQLVAYCIAHGKVPEELELSVFREFSPLFDESVYEAIDLSACVEKRISEGGTSVSSVKKQIAQMREFLKS